MIDHYQIIKYYKFGVTIRSEIDYESIMLAKEWILKQVKKKNIQIEGDKKWKLKISNDPRPLRPLDFGGSLIFTFRGWEPGVFE